ncbi:MAG TPA: VWA domain-containing protein [Egibacteraceae bacterium]|nr:VWA domain-containing protein [Egibacteraceae bacterium]
MTVPTAGEVAAQGPDPALSGLQPRLLDFTRALRRAGVPVAVSDGLDAVRAVTHIDLLSRRQLHEALAATMVKSAGHRPAFDTLFDVYFPPRVGAGGPDADVAPRDVGDLLAELVQRLLDGDDTDLRRLAHEAVESFGRVEGRDGSPEYFTYRVFRSINLAGVLRRALGAAAVDEGTVDHRLLRDELELRLRHLREEIEAEVRRRMVERRGHEDMARRLVRALPEDVDFFRVTADEQAEMRRAVRPLARRLATRLAVKRRRAKRGRLDARRTLRAALGTGGVPIAPAWRSRRVTRPELLLLCDVSGSVAAFAKFTLMFCHALQGQFARVRSFAFIDTVDEVTALFEEGDFTDAMQRLNTEADLVWLDGHSDYGHAFERFHAGWADAVTPRTTVLVLGDARNNYRAANDWVLADLRRRGRRLYWLNPEPAATWNSGDSIARQYGRHCDDMVECRTLRQLAAFVERIA